MRAATSIDAGERAPPPSFSPASPSALLFSTVQHLRILPTLQDCHYTKTGISLPFLERKVSPAPHPRAHGLDDGGRGISACIVSRGIIISCVCQLLRCANARLAQNQYCILLSSDWPSVAGLSRLRSRPDSMRGCGAAALSGVYVACWPCPPQRRGRPRLAKLHPVLSPTSTGTSPTHTTRCSCASCLVDSALRLEGGSPLCHSFLLILLDLFCGVGKGRRGRMSSVRGEERERERDPAC